MLAILDLNSWVMLLSSIMIWDLPSQNTPISEENCSIGFPLGGEISWTSHLFVDVKTGRQSTANVRELLWTCSLTSSQTSMQCDQYMWMLQTDHKVDFSKLISFFNQGLFTLWTAKSVCSAHDRNFQLWIARGTTTMALYVNLTQP